MVALDFISSIRAELEYAMIDGHVVRTCDLATMYLIGHRQVV